MEFPKHWCIKFGSIDGNKREFFRQWVLRDKIKANVNFTSFNTYYCFNDNTHVTDSKIPLEGFKVLTFSEVKAIVESPPFVLPKKWCVNCETSHQADIMGDFRGKCMSRPTGWYKVWDTDSRHSYKTWFEGRIRPTTDYIEITFEQFQKYVLKQEEPVKKQKIIVGWLFNKKDYPQFEKASHALAHSDTGEWYLLGKEGKNYHFTDNSETARIMRNAGVLELWFTPIYEEEKPQFPEIQGSDNRIYKGSFNKDQNVIEYGCAKLDPITMIYLNNTRCVQEKSANRKVKSITLDSGVVITIKQIAQMVTAYQYITNKK